MPEPIERLDTCEDGMMHCDDGEFVRWSDVPQWRDRPTGPGLWLCFNGNDAQFPFITLILNREALDRGAPFHTKRVYGPIPEDTENKG